MASTASWEGASNDSQGQEGLSPPDPLESNRGGVCPEMAWEILLDVMEYRFDRVAEGREYEENPREVKGFHGECAEAVRYLDLNSY